VVHVLLLGPVAARGDDGAELDLGARARRAVLAALAEHPGRVVSIDALTDR
jgi:DNA-binding SARP family transcriptional activator